MAFRGGRRGRGRGGMYGRGVDRIAKKDPYILFPEDVILPSLPSINTITSEEEEMYNNFEHFWPNSCYHLQQESFPRKDSKGGNGQKPKVSEPEEDREIERYSDKAKEKEKREALESYLILTVSNFPSELIQGKKRPRRATKKLRWNLGGKKTDIFAKFDEKYKDNEEDDNEDDDGDEKKKKKKDEEDEDEEEQDKEEEIEESDDDYNQNKDFDDDDDDYNQEDEPDEDYYE